MIPGDQQSENPVSFGIRVSVYSEVDGSTRDLLFRHSPIRVGRNKLNDLVLDHQYVSQWHAMVGFENRRLSIAQVGSSNSVLVDEYRMSPNEELPLTGAEIVRIVPYRLQVQIIALPEAARQEPAEPSPQNSVVLAAARAGTDEQELAQIALRSLDRISRRFLGVPLSDPQQIAAMGQRVEELLLVFFRFSFALRNGQEQFRKALDIQMLGARPTEVEQAADATQLGTILMSLDKLNVVRELESSFKDIMIHQVAMLNGMMAGVRTLLSRLSPRAVLKQARQSHRSPGAKALWQTFEVMHRDLEEEDHETFETIFGPQFAKAYATLAGQKAGKTGARRTPR